MKNLMKKSTSKSRDTKLARGIRVSRSVQFGEREADLLTLRKELGLSPPMASEARVDIARDSGLMSDVQLEAVARLAAQSGGVVAGVSIDIDKTRDAIAYAVASLSFEHQLEDLVLSCRDERLRRRAEVTVPARAASKILNAVASTRVGGDVAHDAQQLRALRKRGRRPPKQAVPAPAIRPVSNDTIAGSG